MTETIRYDEAPAQRIDALSGTPEMQAQRQHVIAQLQPQPGERLLDVGCGSGHLARELAPLVRPGSHVCGLDVSEQMLALARRAGIDARSVNGTSLPFADGEFDAAVATQVYELSMTSRPRWRSWSACCVRAAAP